MSRFFGSGAVFFTKERSFVETINDIDNDVVNLFRVARDHPEGLARAVTLTPWSRTEYLMSYDVVACDDIERARRFLVRMWQGIGSKSSSRTGWRKNVKGVNGSASRFHISLPNCIMDVCARMKHSEGNFIVQIENKDALELISRHNTSDTLIYADPPYMRETRSGAIYKHEFVDDDHRRLLDALLAHKGPLVLSGYNNVLYDDLLDGWRRYDIPCRTEFAGVKIESLWCNYNFGTQLEMEGFI